MQKSNWVGKNMMGSCARVAAIVVGMRISIIIAIHDAKGARS
jgi:hypothetical protein